jgi:hypothetical protein
MHLFLLPPIVPLFLTGSAFARPEEPKPPMDTAEWAPTRVTLEENATRVGMVEAQPAPDIRDGGLELGPHATAVREADLSVCYHQLSAWSKSNLSSRFCTELAVKGSGKVKVDQVLVDPQVEGLERCVETVLERLELPKRHAQEGRSCRAVWTNWTEPARQGWTTDPWPEPPGSAQGHPAWGLVDTPRAVPENARRRAADGIWSPLTLGVRDQPVAAALRLVGASNDPFRRCAGDHLSWRSLPDGVDIALRVIVNEAGVAQVKPDGTNPRPYGDLASCVASRLDPAFPPGEGDVEVPIRVRVRPEEP